VVRLNRPSVRTWCAGLLNFQKMSHNFFNGPLKFLSNPLKHQSILFFLWKTSHLLMSTLQSLILAGVALDVVWRWLVQLIHHIITGGFPLLSSKSGKWQASYCASHHHLKPGRATLSTNKKQGNGEKQRLIGQRAIGKFWERNYETIGNLRVAYKSNWMGLSLRQYNLK
jgi:hypothetical protein